MMMYGRNGGVDVPEIDALTTTRRFPLEWTLQPWTRPDGRPEVFIRDDWQLLGLAERVELARSTVIGRGLEIGAAEADATISEYLAGTTHPGEPS
jgi:hypothetical protein